LKKAKKRKEKDKAALLQEREFTSCRERSFLTPTWHRQESREVEDRIREDERDKRDKTDDMMTKISRAIEETTRRR
jgi:hypothetical protein